MHLRALSQIDGVKPVAVSKSARRLRADEAWLAPFRVADLDAAVEQGASLCIIATETAAHAEDVAAVIGRGIHVLVEKPMARNAEEANALWRLAQNRHTTLFVGCTLRFSESLRAFRDRLPLIGRLHAVRIECQSYLPQWRPHRPYRESYSARADEGGVLRDLIHEIDYAGWLFGWPKKVQSLVGRLARLEIESEEAADLLWEAVGGAAISMRLDYVTRQRRRLLRADGDEGTLEWNGIENSVTLRRDGVADVIFQSIQTREEMFIAQARAFIGAVRGQAHDELASGADGVNALAVCDAARQAGADRRETQVVCR